MAAHLLTQQNRPNGRSSGTSMTRIVLYTTPYCGYCRAAKHLLGKKGSDLHRDRRERRHGACAREMIERAFGRRTVPQIFINDTHVGGYDELAELERAGEARCAARRSRRSLLPPPLFRGNDLDRGRHIPRRPGATQLGPRRRAEYGDGRGADPPRRGRTARSTCRRPRTPSIMELETDRLLVRDRHRGAVRRRFGSFGRSPRSLAFGCMSARSP